jgi:hypothetical protein
MLRIGGFLCMLLGVYLFFSPILAVLNWIPLVGWLLASIASLAAFLIALVFATIFASLTIAFAWLYYRPLFGLLFLAIGSFGIYIAFFYPY